MVRAGNGDLAILGLDCCEMAMAEVWCEMTGGAQIGIGSQASLPYKSWPYDLFLAQLLAKPQSAPNEVAQMLVNSFVEFYNTQAKDSYVTLSACNLELCGDLESAVKPLAEALTAASGDVQSRAGIFSARNSCPSTIRMVSSTWTASVAFWRPTCPTTGFAKPAAPCAARLQEFRYRFRIFAAGS
jgi:hypothetical protein